LCTEKNPFPFFNREPDVKLSVRRCRVYLRFEGDSDRILSSGDRGQTGVYLFCGEAIIFGGEKLFDQAVYDARGAVL